MSKGPYKGEIEVANYEEKIIFEKAALECGYSISIAPLSKGKDAGYHLTFFISEYTQD